MEIRSLNATFGVISVVMNLRWVLSRYSLRWVLPIHAGNKILVCECKKPLCFHIYISVLFETVEI